MNGTQIALEVLQLWITKKRKSIDELEEIYLGHMDSYAAGMKAVLDDLEQSIMRAWQSEK